MSRHVSDGCTQHTPDGVESGMASRFPSFRTAIATCAFATQQSAHVSTRRPHPPPTDTKQAHLDLVQ